METLTTSQQDTFGPAFLARIESISKGYFTVENTETGEHRTFRIRKQSSDAIWCPNAQIVGLLCGPENTNDYENFAFINQSGIHVWSRLRGVGHWQGYRNLLWSLLTEGTASRFRVKYRIAESTRCFICGRELTTPESIDTGIGPVCSGR